MNKELLGVIVCGGQSKRMGTDKGLIKRGYKTWGQLAGDRLRAASLPFIVSINASQKEAYEQVFNPDCLVIDHQNIGGPMNGLLSVHAAYPDKDLLLLACDMVDMQDDIIHHLIDAYNKSNEFLFYAYEVENVVQPFCAIYTAQALQDLMKKHMEQTLNSSSLRYIIEQANALKLTALSPVPFTNYNTLDERKS